MKYLLYVCLVVTLVNVGNSKTLPEFPKPCRRSDPDIQGCYLNSFNRLKPFVAAGVREFNIPSLDPLEEASLSVNQEINDLLAVDAVAKNINVVGLSNFNIDNLNVDIDKPLYVINATFPHVKVSANFKFSIKLANAPLDLQGSLTGDFTDSKLHAAIQFKQIKKDGVEYFSVDNLTSNIMMGNGQVQITPKNPQDQPLADLVTRSFNENGRTLLELASPVITNLIGGVLRTRVAQAFGQVPVERFLID